MEAIENANRVMKNRFYKWELVAICWITYFLNQGDRQIFNVVIPLIKENLHISDIQVGWVATIFTLAYGLMVPLAGLAGDRLSRKWIIFFSLLIFSIGTLFTGWSSGVFTLILFRSIAAGGGEAFYYPAATSLIGQFHHKTRAMAISIHQTSLYAGIILSGLVAGYIGDHYGWQATFYSFGLVGILWAFVFLWRVRDTPWTSISGGDREKTPSLSDTLHTIFKKRTVYFLSLAFGLMCFVNVGYLTWIPTYLHERFGMTLAAAGLHSTLYHFISAFVGVMLGAHIADTYTTRRPKIRMEVELIGLLLGAPFLFWIGQADTKLWTYFAMGLFGVFRGIYDSNLFAALFDVIEPRYRSSSIGIMLSIGFIIGAAAPVLLGWAKGAVGLEWGISLLAVCYLLGAASIWLGIRFFFKQDHYKEVI